MPNNRIYFAAHQVGLAEDGSTVFTAIHGVQSVAISTNFNLRQVFELGQLQIYENIENIPDVEVSLTKVLDGYPLMYHLATRDALTPTLAGRSNDKCIFGLSIFPDTNESAEGTPNSEVVCSGMFVSSVSYNFPLDDNFTEEVRLVGNNKVWKNDPNYVDAPTSFLFTGQFAGNDDAPIGQGGVNQRENMFFAATGVTTDVNGMIADPDCTILPPEVFGVSSSGVNLMTDATRAHLSSISVSCDFGRDAINELGRKGPYHRTVNFPVEVTTQIEVTSASGDMVSATEEGIYTTGVGSCEDQGNLTNRTIRIATCEGTRLYMGPKNKLASVNYSGGDAGGGNVSVSYQFTTFNDLTVMHSNDPNTNFVWSSRDNYLLDL